MRDDIQFETLLDSVLHESANPEPSHSLKETVFSAVRTATASSPVADVFVLAGGLSSEGLFTSLWNGVRERIFPRQLPPLVLESQPIPVQDRMTTEGDYASTAYAIAVHAMAIFLIGFVVRAQIREVEPAKTAVTPLMAPVLHVTAKLAEHTGGGGGQPGVAPVSKGHLPKIADQQIVPPSQPPLQQPKIAIEPTIVLENLKFADNTMPNVGMPNSPLPGVSMGDGRGTGIGPGNGPGVGNGTGGNTGGGLRHVGGSVSKPEVLYMVDPEFSEEARKAKVSGDVMVYLWVDERGLPSHVRVVQGIGMGLDERAVNAVKQYKFKPAMENGKPVTVEMYVQVDFHIF
ncbi:energy transducer TonB [Edaphobacter albus]|uniref:energy transducer TonB n=1 Tax=Edaphobacter sp. 4G125 TaxID=2763071 RepID=UPI0016494C93|nr:energy transducer TonB [Edaphobacter sp. 4G125]QNI37255.1 energy transducer TonB [Edaphobacter sp. 4G125]